MEETPKFFDIFNGKHRGREAAIYSYRKNRQTATNYIVFKMHCQDYQLVAKKQGVNGIPPLSSVILLFYSLRLARC